MVLGAVLALAAAFVLRDRVVGPDGDIYASASGAPLAGLTPAQRDIFARGEKLFRHEFEVGEGLGPLYNGRSCYACHGAPGTPAAAGASSEDASVTMVGSVSPANPLARKLETDPEGARRLMDPAAFLPLVAEGGPVLQRRSVTTDEPQKFPAGCALAAAAVPASARFVSRLRPGTLLGAGLIDAIPEPTIFNNMMRQAAREPDMTGRTNPLTDPLTRATRVGRFGSKGGDPDLFMATARELNRSLGVTTPVMSTIGSGNKMRAIPDCLREVLPPEPNDEGRKLILIADYLALLAPPAAVRLTGEARAGEKIFGKLRCAVCHTPSMDTAPLVEIPDPESPLPKLHYLEVPALENRPVRLYSDLLLHDMGGKLADGIVVNSARGGEWRTTPLWGIRNRKRYLHDGRAATLDEAIRLHGGQAAVSVRDYEALEPADRQALLSFVGGL